MLVIDGSGDRKDGAATAFTGRQWLGRYGKTGNGIVTVTTVWADERVYYPLNTSRAPRAAAAGREERPFVPDEAADRRSPGGEGAGGGVPFRAVVADCAYGDQDGFRADLRSLGAPFAVALRPRRGMWAGTDAARTPVDAVRALAWGGPDESGDWQPVTRVFRDGHAGTWYAADATLGGRGLDAPTRLAAVTANLAAMPGKATWYMATCLPRPGSPRQQAPGLPRPWPSGTDLRAAPLGRAVV